MAKKNDASTPPIPPITNPPPGVAGEGAPIINNPLPRRRFQMLVRVQGNTAGDVARSLLDVIHWLDEQERKAGGANRPLGAISHADADQVRAYSIELDDDHMITPAGYRLALDRWRKRRDQPEPQEPDVAELAHNEDGTGAGDTDEDGAECPHTDSTGVGDVWKCNACGADVPDPTGDTSTGRPEDTEATA